MEIQRMNQLTKYLLEGILETKTDVLPTAIFGGNFSPPHKGHFNVVKDTLLKFPNLKKFIIYVGSGVRDGITQEESVMIWDIYKNHLPPIIEIIPVSSPIKAVYDYNKANPNTDIQWILGSREELAKDQEDYAKRISSTHNYPNITPVNIVHKGTDISGTKARQAIRNNSDDLFNYFPNELSQEEKNEIKNLLSNIVTENNSRENNFFSKMKISYDKFIKAVKSEKNETQEAFKLLNKAAKGEITLTPEQKTQIGNQMKEVLKSLGFLGVLAIPGSTVFLLLLKYFKLNGFITPKSFKEKDNIDEDIQKLDPVSFMKEVAEYCCSQLGIPTPKITLLNKLDFTQENNSFGCYIPSDHEIKVVIKGRNLSDSGRTLSHEIKHHEQNIEGRLTLESGKDGDIFENEANQFSGEIMRHFNRKYPWILTTVIK